MDWRTVRAFPVLVVMALPLVGCGNGDDSSATATPAPPDCSSGDAGDWTMYGQNVCNTRGGTEASDHITPTTVSKLQVNW